MTKMCSVGYRNMLITKIPEKYKEHLLTLNLEEIQKIIKERINFNELPTPYKTYTEDDIRIQLSIMMILIHLIDSLKSDNIGNAIKALNNFKQVVAPFEDFKEYLDIKLIPDLEDNGEILEQLVQLQNNLGIGSLIVIDSYKTELSADKKAPI